MKLLDSLQNFLEKLDKIRDKILISFIKPFWPRKITPNMITWVRVFISILLFVLLFFLKIENKSLILTLFCIGIVTDMFDGSVARGLDKKTEFGAMLDPFADRLLILPIAVYVLFLNEKWLLLALFLMELFNGFTSVFYKSKEIYFESNIFGKTKMVLQSLVFLIILVSFPKSPSEIYLDILWISIIFGILSIFARILELKAKGHITNKIVMKDYKIKKKNNENI